MLHGSFGAWEDAVYRNTACRQQCHVRDAAAAAVAAAAGLAKFRQFYGQPLIEPNLTKTAVKQSSLRLPYIAFYSLRMMASRQRQIQDQVIHHKARVMIQSLRTAFDLCLLKAEAADQLEFNEMYQRDAKGLAAMALSRNPTFSGEKSKRFLEKFITDKYNAKSARIAVAETMSSLSDFVKVSKDPQFRKEAVTREIKELSRLYADYLRDYERRHPGVQLSGMDRMHKEMRYILGVPVTSHDSKPFDLEEYYAEDEEVLEDSLGQGIVGAIAGFYRQLGDVESTEKMYEEDPDLMPPPLASLSEDRLSADQEDDLERYMKKMKDPLRRLEADLAKEMQRLQETLEPRCSPEDFVEHYKKSMIRNPTADQTFYVTNIMQLQSKIHRQRQSIQNKCLLQEFIHGKELESATNDPWSIGTGLPQPPPQPSWLPPPQPGWQQQQPSWQSPPQRTQDTPSALAAWQHDLTKSLERYVEWDQYLSSLSAGTRTKPRIAENDKTFKLTEKYLIGAIEQSFGKGIDVKSIWKNVDYLREDLRGIRAGLSKAFPVYTFDQFIPTVLRGQVLTIADSHKQTLCQWAVFYLKRSLHVVFGRTSEPTR